MENTTNTGEPMNDPGKPGSENPAVAVDSAPQSPSSTDAAGTEAQTQEVAPADGGMPSLSVSSAWDFFRHVFGPAFPVYLPVCAVGVPLMLSSVLADPGATLRSIPSGGTIQLADLCLSAVIPFLSALLSFSWYRRAGGTLPAILALYVGWLGVGFGGCFFVASIGAGASMAVADGAVRGAELLGQRIDGGFHLLLLLHVFIVPWILYAHYSLKAAAAPAKE